MDTVYFGEVVQVYVHEEVLGENRKIDIRKTNPITYSGIQNQYLSLGEYLGAGWSIGKQYQPRQAAAQPQAVGAKFQCDIVERPALPALTIRSRVSPVGVAQAIGQCAVAVFQYASQKGYTPAGALFVAYHGFDGQALDVEIGFPFQPGIEGKDNFQVSEIPGGKAAVYHHTGGYEQLPQARAALEQWLHANGHVTTGVSYDFYLNDPQVTPPDKLETEILFPLVTAK